MSCTISPCPALSAHALHYQSMPCTISPYPVHDLYYQLLSHSLSSPSSLNAWPPYPDSALETNDNRSANEFFLSNQHQCRLFSYEIIGHANSFSYRLSHIEALYKCPSCFHPYRARLLYRSVPSLVQQWLICSVPVIIYSIAKPVINSCVYLVINFWKYKKWHTDE